MLYLTSNTLGMSWVIEKPDFWWLERPCNPYFLIAQEPSCHGYLIPTEERDYNKLHPELEWIVLKCNICGRKTYHGPHIQSI